MNILCGQYRREEASLLFKTEEVISLPFFHSCCIAYNARCLSAYLFVNQHDLKPLKCKLFVCAVLYQKGTYNYLKLSRRNVMEATNLYTHNVRAYISKKRSPNIYENTSFFRYLNYPFFF